MKHIECRVTAMESGDKIVETGQVVLNPDMGFYLSPSRRNRHAFHPPLHLYLVSGRPISDGAHYMYKGVEGVYSCSSVEWNEEHGWPHPDKTKLRIEASSAKIGLPLIPEYMNKEFVDSYGNMDPVFISCSPNRNDGKDFSDVDKVDINSDLEVIFVDNVEDEEEDEIENELSYSEDEKLNLSEVMTDMYKTEEWKNYNEFVFNHNLHNGYTPWNFLDDYLKSRGIVLIQTKNIDTAEPKYVTLDKAIKEKLKEEKELSDLKKQLYETRELLKHVKNKAE